MSRRNVVRQTGSSYHGVKLESANGEVADGINREKGEIKEIAKCKDELNSWLADGGVTPRGRSPPQAPGSDWPRARR